MIKNEKQYKVAKSQLNKLKIALDASINTTVKMPKEIYEAMIAGIQSQVEDVELKIAEYEALPDAKMLTVGSIEDIGQLLIKARVARGYSQKEFAELIGKKAQQIQKYEATEYKSASLERISEIAKALDIENIDTNIPLTATCVCADVVYGDIEIEDIDINIKQTRTKSPWTTYTKLNDKTLNYKLKAA